ncbi:MAG: OmpA family protein [Verrucomicrobia bacterium]|nr:OmpA family protein [Verrucomicrobiota bacterium]MDA1006816.1 OmpA family protein [Verrucomicrobiota bacterium]
MSYEPYESRSSKAFPILLLIFGLLSGGVIYWMNGRAEKPVVAVEPAPVEPAGVVTPMPEVPGANPEEVVEEGPAEILKTIGVGVTAVDPETLVEQIGRSLEKGDVPGAAKLIGDKALIPEQLARLSAMAAEGAVKLKEDRPVSEIGELEINRRARWALNLDDDYGSRIYFDLQRNLNGKWAVEKVMLPPVLEPGATIPRAVLVDALGITDAFLQAALTQDFESAKSFVDLEQVSDAKIAGLCIIFEEGDYRLRTQKPLRALFHRDTTAAFLANVEVGDGSQTAQFGISVQRADAQSAWRVTEINLDTLLADYADRVAGGDVYYTPLIRNPEGGDTLILYFEFDENELTARTKRQLEIVALLLQTDEGKTLTISGHTDALGSEEYNRGLSATRAMAVKDFLVSGGVAEEQIKTVALGQSKPRRPNQTDTGEDNPEGRRANRRTEIYLDF